MSQEHKQIQKFWTTVQTNAPTYHFFNYILHFVDPASIEESKNAWAKPMRFFLVRQACSLCVSATQLTIAASWVI